MATFAQNITIKHQRADDVGLESFQGNIAYGQGLYPLLPGELAMLINEEGIYINTLDAQNNVQVIRPFITDLPGVYIDEGTLQSGNVLIYDSDAGPAQKGGWVNAPAPPPELSGNSIFDLGDVATVNNNIEVGDTLGWRGTQFRPAKSPGQAVLGDLANVNIGIALNGQTLVFDSTSQLWENGFLPDKLGDLTDVDLDTTPPDDGDVLLYNGVRSQWEPGAVAGGNANVVLLDEDQPFPNEPITTLGVTPLTYEDGGETAKGGDFYWVQNDVDNQWGKALREGEVTFSDFSDFKVEDIKGSDTLIASFNGVSYDYVPGKTLPRGTTWTGGTDLVTWSMQATCHGDAGSKYYIATTWIPYLGSQLFKTLGVYGKTLSGERPQIDYPVGSPFEELGCFTFPSGLQAENGLLGIRPVDDADQFDVLGYETDTSARTNCDILVDFRTNNINQAFVVGDLGHTKLEYNNGTFTATVHVGGVTYTETWFSPLTSGVRHQVGFSSYNFGGATTTWQLRIDDVIQGSTFTTPGEGLDQLGTYPIPVPNFFVGFEGEVKFIGGGRDLNPDIEGRSGFPPNFPTLEGMGRSVRKGTADTRILTWEYNEDTWGIEPLGTVWTAFGNQTAFSDLPDVDFESFKIPRNDRDTRYIYWDPEKNKFTAATIEEVESQRQYYLNDSADVDTYRADNTRLGDGDVLRWDASRNTWRPYSWGVNQRVNDAEDVDITANGGLEEGSFLRWSDSDQKWIPADGPETASIALGELTDVDLEYNIPQNGNTLLYSEALQAWTPSPVNDQEYSTLESLTDTEIENPNDDDVLSWDAANEVWVNSPNPEPVELGDLQDVDVDSLVPRNGQVLRYMAGMWRPGPFVDRSPTGIEDLLDVKVTSPRPGEGLIWNGTQWKNTPIASGRGDGGDFDITFTGTGFVTGVYGGGDFDTTGEDVPTERAEAFNGGGDFT